MLNTDLHSSSLRGSGGNKREPMSKDMFRRNLRGTGGGSDLDATLLSELYEFRDAEFLDGRSYEFPC
jgi:Sec7-like guanine-nucleotide exchange factor